MRRHHKNLADLTYFVFTTAPRISNFEMYCHRFSFANTFEGLIMSKYLFGCTI
jgi:hypothetical protein